ncbi:MAG: host attachment protein [Bdellovibrionales bacterium]|nr:host attachment protein [Bdellovibrionales bacterium]
MHWYVIVDRKKARIYDSSSNQLTLLKELSNPLAGLKEKDMRYDKPGSSFAKFSKSPPHNLDSRKSQSENSVVEFSKQVSEYLIKNVKKVKNLEVSIVADRKLIGRLKNYMEKKVDSEKIEWINKGLANIPESKWADILKSQKTKNSTNLSKSVNI